MFREYESKIQKLKEVSEMLNRQNTFDSNFLGTIDNAIKCIDGAWESFPSDYKMSIENDYAFNVVGVMLSAIQKYIGELPENWNSWEAFQNTCREVGDRINYYSNKASNVNSTPNIAEDSLPVSEHEEEPIPEFGQIENHVMEYEPYLPKEPIEEPIQEKVLEIPERSIPVIDEPPEISSTPLNFPQPPQIPDKPKKAKPKSKPQNKVKLKPPEIPTEEKIPVTLKNLFSSDSDKVVRQMEERFTDAKKCVICVYFRDADDNVISSYGLRRGLALGKTDILEDKETVSRTGFFGRKTYGRYFFNYHYSVRFNSKNFIKLPSLDEFQKSSDEIPLSHLVYGSGEDSGSLIKLSFIPKKDKFQVRCEVENDKTEKVDFLSELLSRFDKTEPVGIEGGNGNDDNMIGYDLEGAALLTYKLGQKQENLDSPEVKTEIVVYLEF